MTLILLAIALSVALCVIAYNFAIYALPFMVGLAVFRFVYAADAGFLLSGLAAAAAAFRFAKNPALRLIALTVFAVPAAIAGYALVYGVTKNAIDSGVALNLLCGAGGLLVGLAAMVNLNALGTAVFSR